MSAEKLAGILINSQPNFAWLTCGGRNGIDQSRENGAASLLVSSDGKCFVLANNIEMPRLLSEEISADQFTPVEYGWQQEKASGNFVIETARSLVEGAAITTDYAIEGGMATCRYQLTSEEIERYRRLGKDAGKAVRTVIEKIKPGETETETEIAEILCHELALGGMTSVVTLVAADERISRYRHPVPTTKRWDKALLLVTCAQRGGLIASLSRMICVGGVPDELTRKTEAAAYVNACLLHATRPGATGAALYEAGANAYAERAFADEIDRHHQGGATGYRTRDWVAHPGSKDVVQPQQAFAWNPSITGTKVEDTAILIDGKVEVITATPDIPLITTMIDGKEYHSPGVISL